MGFDVMVISQCAVGLVWVVGCGWSRVSRFCRVLWFALWGMLCADVLVASLLVVSGLLLVGLWLLVLRFVLIGEYRCGMIVILSLVVGWVIWVCEGWLVCL